MGSQRIIHVEQQKHQYSRNELYELRPAFNMMLVPCTTRDHIQQLGIKRRFRGHHGKTARAQRTVKWRASWDVNNIVHDELLRSLPCQTSYESNSHCKIGLVNTRSIRNKSPEFLHFAITEDLDFCAITETWLKDMDTFDITKLKPKGFNFQNIERKDRACGRLLA